jgi:hypothetical protein
VTASSSALTWAKDETHLWYVHYIYYSNCLFSWAYLKAQHPTY